MSNRTAVFVGGLVGVVVVATACRGGSGVGKVSPAAPTNLPPSVALSLERGPCYGRCPEYLVELFDNGAVRFDGRKNVGALGEQHAAIPAADVASLLERFATGGFPAADSAYVEGSPHCGRFFTDGPSAVLSAQLGGTLKVARHDAGCMDAPQFLKTLAAQIDSVARTGRWIAIGNGEK